MVIRTQSEQLTQHRRDIINLFLSDHPLRCVVCDKNGECDLQKYAYEFGLAETSFEFEISRTLYQDDNPFFVRDHQDCILCGKCVRVCDEVVGANAIEHAGRGFASHVATPFDGPMVDSSCVFCGNCVALCPTSALMPKSRLGRGREWELTPRRTVCGYCGVGCSVEFVTKASRSSTSGAIAEAPVNGELLCVKGRFGWDFVQPRPPDHSRWCAETWPTSLGLTAEPWQLPATSAAQRRRPDYFVPVSWETALDIVADAAGRVIARARTGRRRRAGLGQVHQRGELPLPEADARGHRHEQRRPLRPALPRQHRHRPGHGVRLRRDDQPDPRDPRRRLHPDHRLEHDRGAPGDLLRDRPRRQARRLADRDRPAAHRRWSTTPRSSCSRARHRLYVFLAMINVIVPRGLGRR